MKYRHTHLPRPSLRFLFLACVLSFLASACSLRGSSSSTTTGTTSAQTTPTPRIVTTPHPLAKQPPGIGVPISGTPLPSNEIKPLTFMLVYNDAAMEHDVAQIYTPGSPTYHQFLTPDEIIQRYAVSDNQLQQAQGWLRKNGYTIVSTDAFHSAIQVQASVATIERTMKIRLQAYNLNLQLPGLPPVHHKFFMQEGDPQLPEPMASLVQSVIGLDNFAIPQFKPPIGFSTSASVSVGSNCRSYGAKQTLTRNKLAAAYQIDQLYKQNLQGQGMIIGVAEFGDTYDPRDIANYAACAGTQEPHIENIDVDGHLAAGPGQGEAALDLELIAGLAPQAQILDYQTDGQSAPFAQQLVDVFYRVASDHRVQVLSISYGAPEDAFSTPEQDAVNRSLRTLAAEGVSVFISSGDCGAYTPRIHNFAVVSFPASAPYAIAVGGTHLQVNDSNVRTSETVWGNDDGAAVCQNEWGSGGGVSQNPDFKRPSWQVGPGTTNHYNGTSGQVFNSFPPTIPPQYVSAPNGLRQVPDIAAAAYPNIAIYYQGSWLATGGTSAAAPIVAAGTLLVDQALKHQGKAFMGGAPEFYTLANHSGSRNPYNDITTGNNLFYPATRGWDYSTGWGSLNFNDIVQLELA